MMGRQKTLTLLALLFFFIGGPSTGLARDAQFEWTGVERIVAVGDVHGAYDNLVAVLETAGLIDSKKHWIGGKAHLVQNGDIVDRGPESRKCMDLLMKLQERAEDAGGKVHVLIGNHEAMNIIGILDLVSDEEYEAFADRDSRKLRESAFEHYYEGLRRKAKESQTDPPNKRKTKVEFEEQYPLGYIEHRRAFAPDGRYGKWILENNVAIKINDIVFSHGDFSEEFSLLPIEEINERTYKELSGETPVQDGISFKSESPLQYRGLAHTALTRAAQQAETARVDRILSNLGAKAMVVGHTVTKGIIEPRFGGKHISIDVGMLYLYHGGHRVALEIEGDSMRAIHPDGKVPLPDYLDETTIEAYMAAVAAVDPENVDVQIERVDRLREAGDDAAVLEILERLAQSPDHFPFRYRRFMGEIYEKQGRAKQARKQYSMYIEALQGVIAATPDNVNLHNLLARFCIEKKMELDLAESVLGTAREQAPANRNLKLTNVHLRLAQERYDEAITELKQMANTSGLEYERYYLEGLAYLGKLDVNKARAAFKEAIGYAPNRDEARTELDKLEAR